MDTDIHTRIEGLKKYVVKLFKRSINLQQVLMSFAENNEITMLK